MRVRTTLSTLFAMAWIETVDDERARGKLAEIYDLAKRRAGRVFSILRIQSLNPTVLQSSMAIYIDIMRKASPLSRFLSDVPTPSTAARISVFDTTCCW